MPTCINGHYSDSDGKFCVICGAGYPSVSSPSTGGATPPSGGFRSTMKNTPAASTYTPPTYSPPTYSTPTYATPTYTAPVYGGGAPSKTDSRPSVKGMSIAGMVLGIVSLVLFWVTIIGFVSGIVGLILSSIAWQRISSGTSSNDGKGFAIAGFVTSLISVALTIFVIIIVGSLIL